MMNYKNYPFLMIAIILFACNDTALREQAANDLKEKKEIIDSIPPAPPTSLTIYKGAINDKHPIEMQLVGDGYGNLRGSYFYTEYEESLPIKGVKHEDGKMNITVFEVTTEAKEFFIGEAKAGTFSGEWFKVDAGSEKLPFILSEQEKTLVDNDQLTGTYFASLGDYKPSLAVRFKGGESFDFQMALRFPGCVGDVEGTAYFHDKNRAYFYGEDNCSLEFTIQNGAISVMEGDCGYYHGFRCEFTGEYEKASSEVEWQSVDELLN